jgi:catechol 2,3-dioxygenase-like lactoylglutathione lyase family enzyme
MYSLEGPSSWELITLRVRNAELTREFYQDLFGLVDAPADEPGVAVALQGAEAGAGGFLLRLLESAGGDEPELWLSVEVGSVTEVLDLYLLAIMIGARATLPRKRGERWNTVVLDPDGNHISIWTPVPRDSEPAERGAGRRSPRWEWERSNRPGYDAGRERSRAAGDEPESQRSAGEPGEERRGGGDRQGTGEERDHTTRVP